MDLEFITAVLNHSKVSEMVDQLNNYESAFVQLFDNMIIQLKVTSDKSDIRTPYSMLQAAPIYIYILIITHGLVRTSIRTRR